jgi:hypothetical protein
MNNKYLVQIEFRYSKAPKDEIDTDYSSKTITIGVFNDFNEAFDEGNKVLEFLESRFNLHEFPNGTKAIKERFSLNGGCFGSKKTLITNMAYLQTPFSFFAKITELKHESIDEALNYILKSVKDYREWKKSNTDDV